MKRIFFTLLGLLLFAIVLGNTIIVYPGDSIQTAVNVASDGDTVYVHNGTYTETIEIINIELTLEGESRDGCIIRATTYGISTNNTIYANSWSANMIEIKNLTVKQGYIGIAANNLPYCNLYLNNVKSVLNNYGISVNNANSDIVSCLIDDNNYTGLYIMDSNVNIIDCIISNNNFDSTYQYNTMGGGVYVASSNDIYISGTEIIDNYAYDSGGGLAMITTTNSITFDVDSPCTIENNTVQTGEGDDLYAYDYESEIPVDVYTTNNDPIAYPIWDPIEETGCWRVNPIVNVEDDIVAKDNLCFNFPNPARSSTDIMFSNPQSKKTEIIIYNARGQRVEKIETYNNFYTLNVSDYASGVYFYGIRNDNMQSQYNKMIIIK